MRFTTMVALTRYYLDHGEFQQALASAQQAVARAPQNGEAHYLLGMAQGYQGCFRNPISRLHGLHSWVTNYETTPLASPGPLVLALTVSGCAHQGKDTASTHSSVSPSRPGTTKQRAESCRDTIGTSSPGVIDAGAMTESPDLSPFANR